MLSEYFLCNQESPHLFKMKYIILLLSFLLWGSTISATSVADSSVSGILQLKTQKQPYRITWKKVAVWSISAVGGSLLGGREAFHADPTVFERNFGAKPLSFLGSRQWELNYHGNSYLNSSGFRNPHKTEIIGNFGRDYWHTSRYLYTAAYVGGAFIIGNSKVSTKHKLLDLLIQSAVFSVSSTVTYRILRYSNK